MSQLLLLQEEELGQRPPKSAVLSPCEKYRYELRRIWDANKSLVNFVGLNPSIADAEKDDPTIRRCIGFARAWGYGGLIMTNVFAYRLTASRLLKTIEAPFGPDIETYQLAAAREAALVVACWGAHPMAKEPGAKLCQLFEDRLGLTCHCLLQTQPGVPWHPLYLPAHLKPSPFQHQQTTSSSQ